MTAASVCAVMCARSASASARNGSWPRPPNPEPTSSQFHGSTWYGNLATASNAGPPACIVIPALVTTTGSSIPGTEIWTSRASGSAPRSAPTITSGSVSSA